MIHIISDGTLEGTQIIDIDTGNHLENVVSKIDIQMLPGQNKVLLTIPNVSLDIIADKIRVDNA